MNIYFFLKKYVFKHLLIQLLIIGSTFIEIIFLRVSVPV